MEQLKVTTAERKVLKALGEVGTYIHWRNSPCTTYVVKKALHNGLIMEFRYSTFKSLREKKLIKQQTGGGYEITAIGGEAAIKGFYTPGGDVEQRGRALLNTTAPATDTGKPHV